MKKITIVLTAAEYEGIKQYLGEDNDSGTASNEEVKRYVQNVVTSVINAPQEHVSEYIKSLTNL